jgi:threonine/homoserine/homoserine lactone efflux protein
MGTNELGQALSVIGVLVAIFITPGPNNLIVMRAGARAGLTGALPSIASVVVGGLVLLGLAVAGARSIFESWPEARLLLAVAGSGYLCWLGLRLIAPGSVGQFASTGQNDTCPYLSAIQMFAFQLVNPKGWALVISLTATASTGVDALQDFVAIGTLMASTSALCLLLWSLLGTRMSRWLTLNTNRRRFDQAMGLLLLATAAMMLRLE